MAKYYKLVVSLAASLLILYVFLALVDFGLALITQYRCIDDSERAELSEAERAVLSLVEKGSAEALNRAALSIYPDGLSPNDDFSLDFRDLCLAEDVHRVAASMGSEPSVDWLEKFYGAINFPAGGREAYQNTCAQQAWKAWSYGNTIPQKPFSLTRYSYFWGNFCRNTYFGRDRTERLFVGAVRCRLERLL